MTREAEQVPWYEQVDWAVVGERLVVYAVWLLRHRRRICRRSDNIGLGRAAEDLAAEVISDVISGRCNFEYRGAGLESYLRQRVRWKLSHHEAACGSKLETSEERCPGAVDDSLPRHLAARQRLARLRERVAAYMESRRRKFDLLRVLDAVCELGADIPGLARRLGLQPDQVYYQLRVLRRLALELDEKEVDHE